MGDDDGEPYQGLEYVCRGAEGELYAGAEAEWFGCGGPSQGVAFRGGSGMVSRATCSWEGSFCEVGLERSVSWVGEGYEWVVSE